jgi:hypothetical protein
VVVHLITTYRWAILSESSKKSYHSLYSSFDMNAAPLHITKAVLAIPIMKRLTDVYAAFCERCFVS